MAQSQGGQAVSKQNKYPLTPGWFALGGFFTTPVLAALMILGAAILLTAWPFVPMLFYMKRKSELQQIKEAKP
jgi:hypothetical protein